MINLDEINGEIVKLENQTQTYSTIERLAWLYIVRDHITLSNPAMKEEVVSDLGESEFLQVCSGKTVGQILPILNEMVESMRILQPRIYDSVIRKLMAL